MKRTLKENSEESLTRLEVPYLFGTIVLTPFLDETQGFIGMYRVSDKERDHFFGTINISEPNNFQRDLQIIIKCNIK